MIWLSRLSFTQALRWALLWPALVLAAAVVAAGVVSAMQARGDWGFAFGVESAGPLPVWFGVAIVVAVVLFGPSVVFLALWRVSRR